MIPLGWKRLKALKAQVAPYRKTLEFFSLSRRCGREDFIDFSWRKYPYRPCITSFYPSKGRHTGSY